MPLIRQTDSGVLLAVRVIPRSKHSELGGVRDDALVVRLTAPPVDGAANSALLSFLAERCRCGVRSLEIVAGERGRHKLVLIRGVTADAVRTLLTL